MSSDPDRKVALVTGITGQDGSYLTELLLEKGYTVSIPNPNSDATEYQYQAVVHPLTFRIHSHTSS